MFVGQALALGVMLGALSNRRRRLQIVVCSLELDILIIVVSVVVVVCASRRNRSLVGGEWIYFGDGNLRSESIITLPGAIPALRRQRPRRQ